MGAPRHSGRPGRSQGQEPAQALDDEPEGEDHQGGQLDDGEVEDDRNEGDDPGAREERGVAPVAPNPL